MKEKDDLISDKNKIVNEYIQIKDKIKQLNEQNKNNILQIPTISKFSKKCIQCDKQFKSKTEYFDHISNCIQCEVCKKIFETNPELDEHKYLYHEP